MMKTLFYSVLLFLVVSFPHVKGFWSQSTTFSWKNIEETKFEVMLHEASDNYFWAPQFSADMRSYAGQYVCLRGRLDSTLVYGQWILLRDKVDEELLPNSFVAVNPDQEVAFSAGDCEVCGYLDINADDVTRFVFQLTRAHAHDANEPEWIRLMRSPQPNADAIRKAYEDYHKIHPFKKTRYTQEYKRWIAHHRGEITDNGSLIRTQRTVRKGDTRGGGDIWSYAGPHVHYDSDGTLTPGFRHSNVYCHDRSSQDHNVLYCGTESGGAYKTVDGGQHWFHVTGDLIIGDVQSLRINPNNDAVVIMSAANDLWRTLDGGATWSVIGQPSFVSQNIRAWEIAFSPDNVNVIYAATNLGFYKTADGGDNWTEVLSQECNTMAIKPNDPSVVYTIQRVSNTSSQFFKSTDYGETWTMYDTGWFASGVGVLPEGGRLAVTAADPERIYALLVGYQTDVASVIANGWIGAWVSYDAGNSWALPHGLIGAPYTEEHPNLMNFQGDDGDYTQINYNTTMIVSQVNPDKVLIGGLNLWQSNDACATYQGVGGYIGGIDYFHVDQQEYRIYLNDDGNEEIWFSNDGGIGHSADFMVSHANLNHGIQAVNLWGYDQGWNEDMMVGGRYHNGNMAYHELYPAGEFLALGGGEAATGYVNYSDENKTFHSDIGGYVIPNAMSDVPVGFSTSMYPNESYWNNNSSRILFDNNHFNTAWLGRENAIYKSTDGASSFSLIHSFSNNTDDRVLWIEQCYTNANYIYLHFVTGNQSHIYRTTNGGLTWGEMDIPSDLREMVFTVSASNPDELWVAYYYGTNGQKIYHTTDAGANWINLSTPTLNGEEIWSIAHQYGTNGGVYAAVKNGAVYYRNNSMDDWQLYASGLPSSTEPLRIVPFYKGEKIRLATWNLGVWEAPFYESSMVIADFASEQGEYQCPGASIHFVNHSVVPEGATYSWSFPGATPSTSIEENPTVVYDQEGIYDVTLVLTYDGMAYSKSRLNYIGSANPEYPAIIEDFETGGFAANWSAHHSTGGTGNWQVTEDASAFDLGNYAMKFDNWYFDAEGNRDEMWLPKFYFTEIANGAIFFDVAFARYNETWSDTLAVLVSLDCGETWTEVYVKGGTELSTAPDLNSTPFIPNATQWRHEEIYLAPFFTGSQNSVIVAFQNRGYYGQWLYVDNVNVIEAMSVDDKHASNILIQTYPNPADHLMQIGVQSDGPLRYMEVLDVTGKLIWSQELNGGQQFNKVVDVSGWPVGLYVLRVQGEKERSAIRFEVK